MAQVRAFRHSLVELGESLDKLDRETTQARLGDLLDRRQKAKALLGALHTRTMGSRGVSPSASIERRMSGLWYEIDCVAIDPVGQRARLGLVRDRIAEALEQPPQERTLAMTISTFVPSDAAR